jgi:hypothetical protein
MADRLLGSRIEQGHLVRRLWTEKIIEDVPGLVKQRFETRTCW